MLSGATVIREMSLPETAGFMLAQLESYSWLEQRSGLENHFNVCVYLGINSDLFPLTVTISASRALEAAT